MYSIAEDWTALEVNAEAEAWRYTLHAGKRFMSCKTNEIPWHSGLRAITEN